MKKLLDYTVRRRTKDCARGEDCCKGGTHSYYTIQMGKFYDHIYSEDEVILMLARIRDQKEKDRKRSIYNNRERIDARKGHVFPFTDAPKINMIDD